MGRVALDLSGQRFGRLTAVRDIGARRSFRLWECVCDCGATCSKTSASLKHGKVVSCGCFRDEQSSKRNSSDVSGQRFGRLIAVSRIGANKHRHVVWKCRCDCGTECEVAAVALKKGTKSCGCLQKEVASSVGRRNALPEEEKAESRRRSSAKQRAKRKSCPLASMQTRLSRLHRHALASVGAIKRSPTFEALGYTPEQLVKHMERQFQGGMSWQNMRDWHIDHIVPASTAKTEADVVALNQLSNLRPMWKWDNILKRNQRTHLL